MSSSDTSLTLSEHLRVCVEVWAKDPKLNPHRCRIEVFSAHPLKNNPGEFQIDFECTYTYSIWIQALFTPLYVLFSFLSMHEGVEYLEDIAYFKRLTPIGIKKRRARMDETKLRFAQLLQAECMHYNNK